MRTACVALLGVLVAGSAAAQPGDRNSIDIKVRLQGTETWLDEVDAEPGTIVEVGAFYFRDRGWSFAGAIHNMIASDWDGAAGDTTTIVDNPYSALHPDGRVGGLGSGFNFGAQRQDIYTTGIDVGRMRISAFGNPNNVAAGGISVRQNNPVQSEGWHYTDDGVLGYRLNITVGSGVGRTIPLDAPWEDMASFAVYMTPGSTSSTQLLSFYDGTDGALINVVPGVPSFIVLGGGTVGILRRRRSAVA